MILISKIALWKKFSHNGGIMDLDFEVVADPEIFGFDAVKYQ